MLVVDGPVEARRAARSLVERGADWVKVLITGGLYSEHGSVDGGQFADDELVAVMQAAGARGIPVAAHCGSAQMARRFAELGGRSVEHGYALDEAAAAALAAAGTWLVPTIAVTHDEPMMVETGWPHAHHRVRPDGHPATQVMWVDCDDECLLINTETHRRKYHNARNDPRVTVMIWDAADPYRYVEARGLVKEFVHGPPAREHIDKLAQKYFGRPYDASIIKSERVILRITPLTAVGQRD
jgi:PPOX class probable F420-dependent enzyme